MIMTTLTVKPRNQKELTIFKKVLKALDADFDITNDTKSDVLENIKRGFEEMQLIKKGKLKTTPAKDFLNEL
jgi:hypothetical protein